MEQQNPQYGAQQPVNNQGPWVQQTQPPSPHQAFANPNQNPPIVKKTPLRKLVMGISVLIIVLGLTVGTGVLIAYGKIPTSTETRQKVASVVFQIPFIPRTPEYVLAASINAHETVDSLEYDASFALQGLTLPIGTPFANLPLEATMSGAFDYSNLDNLKASSTFNLANQIAVDSVIVDKKSYMQITKLPTLLFSFLGLTGGEFDSLLNTWAYYDTGQLGTEAGDAIQENDKENTLKVSKELSDLSKRIIYEDILPKVVMTDDQLDGRKTHKIYLELTAEEFVSLVKKTVEGLAEIEDFPLDPEDIDKDEEYEVPEELRSIQFTMWIDSETFYLHKSKFYVEIVPENQSSDFNAYDPFMGLFDGEQVLEIIGIVNFSKHGEQIDITAPDDAIPMEEFVQRIFEVVSATPFGALAPNPAFMDDDYDDYFLDDDQQFDNNTLYNNSGTVTDTISYTIEPTDSDHIRGNQNAPIILIEYSDLECPFCARFHQTAQQAVDEYNGQVAWIYRHFPLETIHPNARRAANGAECARYLGGRDAFWQYTDLLFNDITYVANPTNTASLINIDFNTFTQCIESEQYDVIIETHQDQGLSAGVTGTPGSFIYRQADGEAWYVPGAIPLEQLKTTINEALESTSSTPSYSF